MWKRLKGPDGRDCYLKTDEPQRRSTSKAQLLAAIREGIQEGLKPLTERPDDMELNRELPKGHRVHVVSKNEEVFKGLLIKTPIHRKPTPERKPGVFDGVFGDAACKSQQDPILAGLHDVVPGRRAKAEPERASFAGCLGAGVQTPNGAAGFRIREKRSRVERITAKSETNPIGEFESRSIFTDDDRKAFERRTGVKLRSKEEIAAESAKIRYIPDGLI
jgi:hypothetical protein